MQGKYEKLTYDTFNEILDETGALIVKTRRHRSTAKKRRKPFLKWFLHKYGRKLNLRWSHSKNCQYCKGSGVVKHRYAGATFKTGCPRLNLLVGEETIRKQNYKLSYWHYQRQQTLRKQNGY